MKKAYSKPKIVFDSFELSESIAAGCEVFSNHAHHICGVDIGEAGTVFNESSKYCTLTPPSKWYDSVCYDVPSSDNNVFSS